MKIWHIAVICVICYFLVRCEIIKEKTRNEECSTYPTEIDIMGITVNCDFNKETYTYTCVAPGVDVYVYQYGSQNDFIKEGKQTGVITRLTEKITYDFSTYIMYEYVYDENNRLTARKTDLDLDGNYDEGTATAIEWDEHGRPEKLTHNFIIKGYVCTNVTLSYNYDDKNLTMIETQDYTTSEGCTAAGIIINKLYFNKYNYLIKSELSNDSVTIDYEHNASARLCD